MGSVFALSAAFFWAMAVILYKKSQDQFSPVTLNIYKSLVAFVLVSITMLVLDIEFFPDKPVNHWLLLSLSGVLGIALADIFFFIALNFLGAGLVAIVECLYLPSVLVFSFLIIGETLSFGGIMGGVLVLTAVLVGSFFRPKLRQETRADTKKNQITGIAAGITATLFLSLGIVIVKDVLEQSNVFWATLVRVSAGLIALLVILIFHPDRRRYLTELKPSGAWLTALPASICGNYIALTFWVAGMKYTTASRAAILNQMSTIFIFILATIFLN